MTFNILSYTFFIIFLQIAYYHVSIMSNYIPIGYGILGGFT